MLMESSPYIRAAGTYRRVCDGAPATRQDRAERDLLDAYAHAVGVAAERRQPRLIRVDRPLKVLSLQDMLQSHPAYDPQRVDLLPMQTYDATVEAARRLEAAA